LIDCSFANSLAYQWAYYSTYHIAGMQDCQKSDGCRWIFSAGGRRSLLGLFKVHSTSTANRM